MSSKEVMQLSKKADNDQNAVLVAKLLNESIQKYAVRVKRVIFLTNTNGILDANNQTVK
jgi:hypothetical protein